MDKELTNELKNEEIRGLFVLGLLAVLASVRLAKDTMIVIVGQAKVDIIPIINIVIILWSVYAFFMIMGLSSDIFGPIAAQGFRQGAKIILQYNFWALGLLGAIIAIVSQSSEIFIFIFIAIFGAYYLYYKISVFRKGTREKTKMSETEKRYNFCAIGLLICITLISYFQNNVYVIIPSFIAGCIFTCLIIAITEKRRRNAENFTNNFFDQPS